MKNDARKVVEDMLTSIVLYVNYTSGGGKTAIISTGLNASSDSAANNHIVVAATVASITA